MNILVSNRQKISRPNLPSIRRLMSFFMDQARRRDTRQARADLSLVLMDDAGMMLINRLYLDRADVTDVISFSWPPGSGRAGRCAGEVFVNVQRAVAEGRKRWSAQRELALYMAHGCDHVSGESDRLKKGRLRMRRRELRWLKKAAEQHLLNDLLNHR